MDGDLTFNELREQARGFEGDKIRVPVNSYGGSVLEALAIYNFLIGHNAEVETHIPTFAMSAGTVIAAAGDTVTMADNGFYMIHNPWTVTVGDKAEHDKSEKLLGQMTSMIADIYKRKTGLKKAEILNMMNEETWLTAKEAKKMGFVDQLTKGAKFEASFNPEDLEDLRNIPQVLNKSEKNIMENTLLDNILSGIRNFF